MLVPQLDRMGKEHGFSFVWIGLGGCIPLVGVDVVGGNYNPGTCRALTERQYEFIKTSGILNVVLASRWSLYTQSMLYNKEMSRYFLVSKDRDERTRSESREVFLDGFENTLKKYERLNARVSVILQVPQQLNEPRKIYNKLIRYDHKDISAKEKFLFESSVKVAEHLRHQEYSRMLLTSIGSDYGVQVFDPSIYLCGILRCTIGTVETSFYLDSDHLNDAGVRQLAPLLKSLIGSIRSEATFSR
jgi:hypothetical protein